MNFVPTQSLGGVDDDTLCLPMFSECPVIKETSENAPGQTFLTSFKSLIELVPDEFRPYAEPRWRNMIKLIFMDFLLKSDFSASFSQFFD